MESTDLSTYSPEQIAQLVVNWPSSEIAKYILQLSPEQLEAAGKNLSLPQALALLDYTADADPQFHWKLSPLLVGMPHPLFSQLLLASSPHQLEILKLEAVTEPIQHQLTLQTHEITHQLPHVQDLLDQIAAEIVLIPITGSKDPSLLKKQLKAQADWYESTLNMIIKVLALAWNSNRPDLIDKLSHAKEWYQRTLTHTIGQPKTPFGEAKGLFSKLEEALGAIYGGQEGDSIESADDDEPALEGLSRFSLWYLKDYHQVGLLPQIADPKELDLDPATHTEQERLKYREKLLDEVRQNLNALGLQTIKDLKQAGIYSLEALLEHIGKTTSPEKPPKER